MFFRPRKNRDEHRFYLLPGMGRSNRKHHKKVILWAWVVGALAALTLGGLLYVMNDSF